MEAFLDIAWNYIVVAIDHARHMVDGVFAPLNIFGPAVAISSIALVTVILTKFLSKTFKTRRYRELREEFIYWYQLRREALKCKDPDKARLLAKNIDQAKLNRLYYDYFFEGLLNALATKYLPLFILLAYVNETYRPANLLKRFGRNDVLTLGGAGGKTLSVGAVFWFAFSVILIYLGWYLVKKIPARSRHRFKPPPA